MDDDIAALVLDGGSYSYKAGLISVVAGEGSPRVNIPPIIGRRAAKSDKNTGSGKEVYIGLEAQKRRSELKITNTIHQGTISYWDDMSLLWTHIFDDMLYVSPEHHRILLSDSPLSPKAQRANMAEVMFERFHVPGVYIMDQAALCFYEDSEDGLSGVAVDVGDSAVSITPVYEGYSIRHAAVRLEYGGGSVSDCLAKSIIANGYCGGAGMVDDVVGFVKEVHCYVALDYEEELLGNYERRNKYALPDGKFVTCGHDIFSAPEVLFMPSSAGIQMPGIDRAILDVLHKCDPEMRGKLCRNIVLCGGTTLLSGFADRLTKELTRTPHSLLPHKFRVRVRPERKDTVWIGGSILASLSTFDKMWVMKRDYEEFGPSIINWKCL